MTPGLTRVKIAPKGMGLNDFVAFEEGFLQPKVSTLFSTGKPSKGLSRVGRASNTWVARKTSLTRRHMKM